MACREHRSSRRRVLDCAEPENRARSMSGRVVEEEGLPLFLLHRVSSRSVPLLVGRVLAADPPSHPVYPVFAKVTVSNAGQTIASLRIQPGDTSGFAGRSSFRFASRRAAGPDDQVRAEETRARHRRGGESVASRRPPLLDRQFVTRQGSYRAKQLRRGCTCRHVVKACPKDKRVALSRRINYRFLPEHLLTRRSTRGKPRGKRAGRER